MRFIRINDIKYQPMYNWRLDAVSILNGGTADSSVEITGVQMLTPSDTFTVTNPGSYDMEINWRWMRYRLPLWGVRTQVVVNTTEHSMESDTDIATLHYDASGFGLHRKPMTLVSSTADLSAYRPGLYGYAGYTRYGCVSRIDS